MLGAPVNWLRRGNADGLLPIGSSIEAIVMRSIGLLVLTAFGAKTFFTAPHPGIGSAKATVLLAALVVFIALVLAILATLAASMEQPLVQGPRVWLIVLLLALTVDSGVVGGIQPEGSWQLGPALVACFAAIGLERTAAAATFGCAAGALLLAAAIAGGAGGAGTMASVLVFTALPWFVVFRLLREVRGQRDALDSSRAAEARAAAVAERGRLAREMHDVLAHSLSALALHLESTRLLARERHAGAELAGALDRAHQLAADGLEEARHSIAAARGDEMPGPERIGALAEAFRDQSGLPVSVVIGGEPREIAPDARLAIYRTAQEALTNIRRHATPERVDVKLDYLPGRTVLVVEDHAAAGAPPPTRLGLSGGYGLTGMRERAELLGGRLLAGPSTDGFRVELWLPTGSQASRGRAQQHLAATGAVDRRTSLGAVDERGPMSAGR